MYQPMAFTDFKDPEILFGLPSASLIILFCLAFIYGSVFLKVNTLVGIVQSALVLITLGFISFTNYFIDLSGSIGLSLSFFAICKFHQSIFVHRGPFASLRAAS